MVKYAFNKLLFTLLFFGIIRTSYSQDFTEVSFPMPDAFAFAKQSINNLNYSTGKAIVSIPMAEIGGRNLNVKIGLNYNGGGIKVEEEASSVGLGWTLNYGGLVTRVMRGIPDDKSNGFISNPNEVSNFKTLSYQDQINYLFETIDGQHDTEPDEFIYNFNGYSGRFIYDPGSSEFVQYPLSDIKIEAVKEGTLIKGWILTTPKGDDYFFGLTKDQSREVVEKVGTSTSTNYSTLNGLQNGADLGSNYVQSWYLVEIHDASELDSIIYHYSNLTVKKSGRSHEMDFWSGDMETPVYRAAVENGVMTSFYLKTSLVPKIDSIISLDRKILFKWGSTTREDLEGDKALDQIEILNQYNEPIKTFDFKYKYFVSTDLSPWNIYSLSYRKKRLCLEAIHEYGSNQLSYLPHEFTYFEDHILPDKLSTSQDYWGYYNGKSNGLHMLPESYLQQYKIVLEGADRSVDTVFAKACTLKEIKYPSGSSKEFIYEGNKASNSHQFGSQFENMLVNPLVRENIHFYQMPEFKTDSFPGYDVYDTIFTVTTNLRGLIDFQLLNGCVDYQSTECDYSIVLRNLSQGSSQALTEESGALDLNPGQYKLEVKVYDDSRNCLFISGPDNSVCRGFEVFLSWYVDPLNISNFNSTIRTGGLRVREINLFDGDSLTLTRSFRYQVFGDSISSGELFQVPAFVTKLSTPSFYQRLSNSAIDLINDTFYTNVTEYKGVDKEDGKTEYSFLSDSLEVENFSDFAKFPFPKKFNTTWLAGLPHEEIHYRYSGGAYTPIQRTGYEYKKLRETKFTDVGIKMGSLDIANAYDWAYYSVKTNIYLVSKTTTLNYENGGHQISQSIEYKHRDSVDHFMPTKIVRNGDDIETIVEDIKYTNNFYGDPLYASLFDENVIVPIQTTTFHNSQLMRRRFIEYDSIAPNVVLPISVSLNENGETAVRVVQSLSYNDSDHQLKSVEYEDGLAKHYLWSTDGLRPIAEIVDAHSSYYYHTSFESNGNVSGGYSGNRSFSGDFLVAAPTKPGDYILSYRKKESGSWKRYEVGIGLTDILLSGHIDEVRVYPRAAQMTTYTYSKSGKIISVCDANGTVQSYEYDDFDRLKKVVDHNGHIMKSYDYQIKNQVLTNQ